MDERKPSVPLPAQGQARILALIPGLWISERRLKLDIAKQLETSVYSVAQQMRLLFRYEMIEKREQPELRARQRAIPLYQVRRAKAASVPRLRMLRRHELKVQSRKRDAVLTASFAANAAALRYLDPIGSIRELPEEDINDMDQKALWELVRQLAAAVSAP